MNCTLSKTICYGSDAEPATNIRTIVLERKLAGLEAVPRSGTLITLIASYLVVGVELIVGEPNVWKLLTSQEVIILPDWTEVQLKLQQRLDLFKEEGWVEVSS